MAVFIDTSALFAALNAEDDKHQSAQGRWISLLAQPQEMLITSNYVMLETIALTARRLGFQAVRDLQGEFMPALRIHWVEKALHDRAVAAMLTAGRRDLSLVDCVSFEVMRQLGLDVAFSFDAHFAEQGFRRIP